MPSLLDIYQNLPYPFRVAAASARGIKLRNQRYGKLFEQSLEEAIDRESWGMDRWKRWQEEKLAQVLHIAATKVPWYRKHWEQRRRAGDQASWEILSNWPILEKQQLRENGRAIVREDIDIKSLSYTVTSGTTGTPTELWNSSETLQRWYAQVEARMRRWHGISRHDRWAHLGGKQVASPKASKPPYWVWNSGLNQLYLSTYHLRPGNFKAYADAIRDHGVESIIAYASSLHELARGFLEEGVTANLKVTLTDGEPVFSHYRGAVRRAFNCELRETYGMVEMAAAASECPHGSLHIWPDTGIVEIIEDGRAAADGEPGEVICTGLLNIDMPLIRYQNGDRAAVSGSGASCSCGRTLPILREIEGRMSDMIYTPDGRRLAPSYVEIIYDELHPIAEAQLVQHTIDRVTLRYVPLPAFDAKAEQNLRRSVVKILGESMHVSLEPMARIPRGPNGKMRAVLSELTRESLPSER